MKLICLFLTLISCYAYANSDQEIPVPTADLVKLSAKIYTFADGDHLVLHYKNYPKWHTYWKNPGDAGLPISTKFFSVDKEVQLPELEWPAPKTYVENGGITAYGYESKNSFFYKIPSSLAGKPLTIKSHWLVCKHICIPGKQEITIDYQPQPAPVEIQTMRLALPTTTSFPEALDLVLTKNSKEDLKLVFYYNLQSKDLVKLQQHRNLLTPFLTNPFDIRKEELFKDKKGNIYGRIHLDFDGEYAEPPIAFPADGNFAQEYNFKFLYANPFNGRVEVINKSFSKFSLNTAENMQNFYSLLTPIFTSDNSKNIAKPIADVTKDGGEDKDSLIYYLLLAFVGGLILNIMPCVLPIITMKLFGMIKIQNTSRSEILLHNLFYSLGIFVSFMVLAAVILVLKSTTSGIGWGFQLQSPRFVALMILFLFVLALNMFGLYEFKTPGGQSLGNIQLKKGIGGDFLSGVLATILSTPCSAPFLGTALTFAFTSSAMHTLLIFSGVALGLAFPFLLTGVFPSLVSFLPKPGEWMNDFKKFLGLTLILTAIWLLDVFSALVENNLAMIKLNSILALIFFAVFSYKKSKFKKLSTIPALLMALFLLINMNLAPLTLGSSGNQLLKEKQTHGLPWEKWSVEKMQEYQTSGDLVFMDFTAKWCFTCKVNEKLVLDTNRFKKLVEDNNIKLLLADWTKRDPLIGNYLKSHKLVGVPAYFIQKRNGELIKLGETISLNKIKKNLN